MDKEKFTLEYDMRGVSSSLLWQYLSTPQGLEAWFAPVVSQNGKIFTLGWDGGQSQQASLSSFRTGVYIRFHWLAAGHDHSFFEMRIIVSELTGEKALQITDFASPDDDADELRELWDQQIDELKRNLGL